MSWSTSHRLRRRCTKPPTPPQATAAWFDSFEVMRGAAAAASTGLRDQGGTMCEFKMTDLADSGRAPLSARRHLWH